jgi:hypothetical protein
LPQQLASIRGRLEELMTALESGARPGRAALEETLTDGYALALELDAECTRLERSIGMLAAEIDHESSQDRTRELSRTARRLARSKRELVNLRGLLSSLRAEAAEARVA